MIILGISWGSNSSCCLMINGKVIVAQHEERFKRIKNYDTWPGEAIKSCLRIAKIQPKKIDAVVWAGNSSLVPHYFLTNRYSNFSYKDMVTEQNKYWYPTLYENKKINYLNIFKNKINIKQAPGEKILNILKKNFNNKKGQEIMRDLRYILVEQELGIKKEKVFFIEHHECHAFYSLANTYKKNTNKKYLIFTLDGSGDKGINATVSVFYKNKLNRIFSSKQFILGRIYRHITLILGMKWGEHEYKTMGLAPYSSESYSNGPYKIFKKSLLIYNFKKIKKKIKDCYFSFLKPLSYFRFDGIAQGLQKFTEEIIVKWFSLWIKKKKIYDITYSGGVSMNVKANLEISKIKEINSLNIMGAGTDDSLSIGACYAFSIKNNQKVYPIKDLYLGYEISELEITNLIKKISKKKFTIIKNPNNKLIANLLNVGLILGRCKGKMEFGARALGNRSIIANPSSQDTIRKINQKIKSRDFWMPFAPSVLEEEAKNYFKIIKNTDYTQMSVCVEAKENINSVIPAVLHPSDFTARIHLVKKEINNDYYDLIKNFKQISGIGLILNTSLNLHGKPIARNANDCLEILNKSDIDGMQIENFLFIKKNNNKNYLL